MRIMGIDPGPVVSGVVIIEIDDTSAIDSTQIIWTSREGPAWENGECLAAGQRKVRKEGTISNGHLRLNLIPYIDKYKIDVIVIEGIEHRGKMWNVGGGTFQTLVWIGIFSEYIRFYCTRTIKELLGKSLVVRLVLPYIIRKTITGVTASKNRTVKEALIERFGEIGKKGSPGILWELAKPKQCRHLFSAFAVAQTYADLSPADRDKLPSPESFWSEKEK